MKPSSDHWTSKPVRTDGLEKCPGICPRLVTVGTGYCCSGCRVQSQNGNEPGVLGHGDHPMLSHSEGCDARDAERRPGAWLSPPSDPPSRPRATPDPAAPHTGPDAPYPPDGD